MKTSDVQESLARAKARRVLIDLSLEHPYDMDIRDIAWARGVAVHEGDMRGADGWLVRMGGKGIIRVKQGLPEAGRRRFVIAHELGHFELHRDRSQLALCSNKDLIFEYQHVRPEEREASIFATELLLPEALVRPRCGANRLTFADIRQLADEFKTTITMTAMRMVELAASRAALAVCEGGRVKFCRFSPDFEHFIEGNSPLDSQTLAAEYFDHARGTVGGSSRVPATAWIKDRRVDSSATLMEECFAIPRYDSVLALLTLDQEILEQ